MVEAKTLASTLAGYKVSTVHWRYILNNTTSTRPKKCGGPTCDKLIRLLAYHRVGDLQQEFVPFSKVEDDVARRDGVPLVYVLRLE